MSTQRPLHRAEPTGEGERAPGAGAPRFGVPAENRRQLLVKLCWLVLWMVYLMYPVADLTGHRHDTTALIGGAAALTLFVAVYVGVMIYRATGHSNRTIDYGALTVMVLTAVGTSFGLGEAWLTLFTYTSVSAALILPVRYGPRGVLGVTALAAAVGVLSRVHADTFAAILLPTFLSGIAMTGLQRLVAAMRELREARATVAHLAASEERLRLARDLHDLLGHSLSLIAIKSELAGRFMDGDRPDAARAQVADIEKVARQSLADVRAAVSGFRRPTLPVELAAARTALTAAQVRLEADPALDDGLPGLGDEEAGALAWALREAVTNVVRHGTGAAVCAVHLDQVWEGDGARFAVLDIADDGPGPGKSGPGNGLSGLEERLLLVGGRLETSAGLRGQGFRLRALVPLRAVPVGQADRLPE